MKEAKKQEDPFMDSISKTKERYRLKDLKDYNAGVSGNTIMKRNAAINPESARQAHIRFG